jgi:hypothetical protein
MIKFINNFTIWTGNIQNRIYTKSLVSHFLRFSHVAGQPEMGPIIYVANRITVQRLPRAQDFHKANGWDGWDLFEGPNQ